jgi:signal transduction histidine kinase
LEADKQRFIGVIANKLHSPLNSLRRTIGHLREQKQLDERGGEHLSVADSNIDRLIRMVAELLSLDQLQDSRLEMTYRRVNLQEVIKLSCEAVSEAAARAHVRIEMASPDIAMLADHDRVVQVIVNLLANAIKFSPEGSTVTVSSVDAGQNVQISVADRGRGMPEEFRERLFARFAQAYESDSADKGGFGLGLSICKMIVDQHQGKIDVQSKLGEGTTFIVTLPKEPPSTASAAAVPSREISRKTSRANFPRWLTADAHLWQKGILLVGLPLLFQIIFAGSLMFMLVQANHHMDAAEHARKFNSLGQWLRRTEMELAEAGLYYRLVHMQPMLDTYYSLRDRMRRECDELAATATPEEHSIAVRLRVALEKTLPLTDSFAKGKGTDTFDDLIGSKDIALQINANLHDVDKLVQELGRYETKANADMLPEGTRRDIQNLLFVALGFNVVLAGALLVFVNRSITMRIHNIIDNTHLLSRRQALMKPQDGSDEIASIDQSFYTSAEKLLDLERFKDEMVSMVSHDIRTPLTTINGALSLAGVGAFGELPPELQAEVESADTESNELISLVNDLLTAEKSKSGTHRVVEGKTEQVPD